MEGLDAVEGADVAGEVEAHLLQMQERELCAAANMNLGLYPCSSSLEACHPRALSV